VVSSRVSVPGVTCRLLFGCLVAFCCLLVLSCFPFQQNAQYALCASGSQNVLSTPDTRSSIQYGITNIRPNGSYDFKMEINQSLGHYDPFHYLYTGE
jgi:hypothetical protein